MKKLFIPIAMCAAIAAASISVPAYAEGNGETFYPSEFLGDVYEDLGTLTDYAAGENGYAVTDGEKIITLENDGRTVYEDAGAKVVSLDYYNGKYYYKTSRSETFTLPDKATAEHEFIVDADITVAPLLYYTLSGDLKIYNRETEQTVTLAGYTCLKQYGESVYALHEGKISIIEGIEGKPVELKYVDFKDADSILTGNTAELLKKTAEPKFVELAADSYKTEINLDKLYKPSRPDETAIPETYFTAGGTTLSASGETALLLCYTGNAAVISIDGKAFVTMKDSVTELTRTASGKAEFENASVCTPFDYIYSAAYMCEGTKLTRVDFDAAVKVLSKISAGELESDFYKVEYTADGETVTGYIPCAFLRETQVKDNPQINTPDPDYSEENLKQTVILIIVVIALILTAIGYLTYIGTSGKKKKNKNDKNKNA